MIKINKKKEPVTLGNYRSSIPKKNYWAIKSMMIFVTKAKKVVKLKNMGIYADSF